MTEHYSQGGHWPMSDWPKAWKQPAREPTIIVRLDCRCWRKFPEPAPVVGSQVSCGQHLTPARVVAHDSA